MTKLELYTFEKLKLLPQEQINRLCARAPTVEFLENFIRQPANTGKLVQINRENGLIIVKIKALKAGRKDRNDGQERRIVMGKNSALQVLQVL